MSKIIATAAVLALTSLLNISAANAAGLATIEANERNQMQRIEQGYRDGSLTNAEYRRLIAEQARIDAMERRALADGRLTPREYNQIHDAQINASQHIKQERTDGEVNWYRRWLYRHGY